MTDRAARGLLVAAPRSGSGKTTVTLAILRALARRGVAVAGAKCGPDYIDPAFHAAATGRPSFNLDSFAMTETLLDAVAGTAGQGAEFLIAEGSMGLFDGVVAEEGRSGANADIAARYGWPVILVLDVSGAAQSAAAVALGCRLYDPRLQVAGVILNKVASPRHRRLVEAGLARTGLPVLGALARDTALALPERHLGLVQAEETGDLAARLDRLADLAETALDLDAIVAAAAGRVPPAGLSPLPEPPGQRIALARDAAFSFIYPHMAAGWRAAGAELVPFSPLADEPPPEGCDACWLPGGYPELHAGQLAAAGRFLAGLRDFARTRPVHGECGGYMVLGEGLEDAEGRRHAMAGLLPVATSYARRKLHLGYRVATLLADGPLGPAGAVRVGHEFHYASELTAAPDESAALARVTDGEGRLLGVAGHRRGRVSGSFFHLIGPR
ncbi:cobyrinate a,c-diamide synthase [Methylobacterium nodulans]|uniref:Hydrogenobyrinate a,c-diamide synthase n=1 Tax=Methylobacterium nodulans (strain LMG 21967 / CNCM I-2342 / ORS 2060) TaxID=460265 RepID=B8IUS4_METNO|nr:cobyrinate a,c-diamide synthase [Methylobacterium nodulans]ACL57142.1 cobyrinic acid a,c-diamide synthase [Methylobacterium nodulans ORS 2060]